MRAVLRGVHDPHAVARRAYSRRCRGNVRVIGLNRLRGPEEGAIQGGDSVGKPDVAGQGKPLGAERPLSGLERNGVLGECRPGSKNHALGPSRLGKRGSGG